MTLWPLQETLILSPSVGLKRVAKDVQDMIDTVGSQLDKLSLLADTADAYEKETAEETKLLLEKADTLLSCARPLANASTIFDGSPQTGTMPATQLDDDDGEKPLEDTLPEDPEEEPHEILDSPKKDDVHEKNVKEDQDAKEGKESKKDDTAKNDGCSKKDEKLKKSEETEEESKKNEKDKTSKKGQDAFLEKPDKAKNAGCSKEDKKSKKSEKLESKKDEKAKKERRREKGKEKDEKPKDDEAYVLDGVPKKFRPYVLDDKNVAASSKQFRPRMRLQARTSQADKKGHLLEDEATKKAKTTAAEEESKPMTRKAQAKAKATAKAKAAAKEKKATAKSKKTSTKAKKATAKAKAKTKASAKPMAKNTFKLNDDDDESEIKIKRKMHNAPWHNVLYVIFQQIKK